MFKAFMNSITDLFNLVTINLGTLSDLSQAGRLQATVVLLASEEDVAVKTHEIQSRTAARMAALQLLQ